MKEREMLLPALSLFATFLLLTTAFSRNSRDKIHRRDNVCTECGAWDRLECSHLNHDKSRKEYDDPENGVLLCSLCHYLFHLAYKEDPTPIGLSKNDNDWAIEEIWKRLPEKQREVVVFQRRQEKENTKQLKLNLVYSSK